MARANLSARVCLIFLAHSGAVGATPPTKYSQGVALLKANRPSEAITQLKSVAGHHCDAMAYYLMGVAYMRLSQAKLTAKAVGQSLECSPPLSSDYRPDALGMLKWSRSYSRRSLEITLTLSEEDEKQKRRRAEAEEKEIARIVNLYLPDNQLDSALDIALSESRCQTTTEDGYIVNEGIMAGSCLPPLERPDVRLPNDPPDPSH
jgi:hypothetical protein